MTDGIATQAPAPDGQPGRPSRLVMVLGAGAAVALLAAVGAVGGWVLAGDSDHVGDPQAGSTAGSSTPAQPTSTPQASRPTTGRPTGTTRPPDGFVLPDLAGRDFEQARTKLRGLGLGWKLIFQASDDDGGDDGRRVGHTEPGPGAPVRRGDTVHVFVVGAAPSATVPGVVGMSCRQAGALVVDHGLYPRYPSGDIGQVLRQDPESPGDLRWNDWVQLYCGDEPMA